LANVSLLKNQRICEKNIPLKRIVSPFAKILPQKQEKKTDAE
jgi:hypothetical protein